MTRELLEHIQTIVNYHDDKQLVVWTALVAGFHLVLHKSNIAPLKRVHDTVHNVTRSNVCYSQGVMVIFMHWSKTNQSGEYVDTNPLVANPDSKSVRYTGCCT